MAWYVLFVKTGYEQKIANEISRVWRIGDSKPFVPMYEAHFKRAGRVYPEKRRMCPGYVFIDSELNGLDFYKAARPHIIRSEKSLKLLRYGKNDSFENKSYEMKREEYVTFLQLYNEEYCIEMSKGFVEGDLVYIADGPLKGFESRITKVRASKMEAVVAIEMMGRLTDVKVGLEIIKKLT